MPINPAATRLAALAGLIVGLAMLFGTTPAAGAGGGETIDVAIPPTGRVSCVDNAGRKLGADPTLHAGDHATCKVTGLDAGEKVTVTIDAHGRDLGPVTTNAKGGLTFRFKVPLGLSVGAHRLVFAGQRSKTTAVQAFRVATGHPGGHRAGPGPGGLVFTGADVIGPLVAAAALIAAGTTLTVANRRRRRLG